MIEHLIEDLKSDEGWRPFAYQDHLGFWTIGFGFLIDERRGGELPLEIAEDWLIYAATKRWDELLLKLPWLIDQPGAVQRAVANMAYQLGVNGVGNFAKMLSALKSGDRQTAEREALNSKWAKQTPARANRVATMMRGGSDER